MKRCIWLLLAFVLLVGGVSAQEGEDTDVQDTIYIDLLHYQQTSQYDDEEVLNLIIEPLSSELGIHGIEVIVIHNNHNPKNFPISIQIAQFRERWAILPHGDEIRHEIATTSPILLPGLFPSYIYFEPPLEATTLQRAVGLSLYAINRCDLATPHWQAASTTEHNDSLFYLGNCALLNRNYDSAVEFFEEHLALSTKKQNNIAPNINLSWAYLQAERDSEAYDLIDSYAQPAIDNAPEGQWWDVFYLIRSAKLYALTSDYDDAIICMDAAITIVSNTPDHLFLNGAKINLAELYTLRGQMWLLLYEWDEVLADYNTAIELDPTYPDAYFYRGVLYYSVLQAGLTWREEALADFEQYLELSPEGDLAEQARDYADAIRTELDAING
jgi:lipoprotein NlpI